MFKNIFLAGLLAVSVAKAEGKDTIAYHAAEVPLDGLYFYVDLDQDGSFDYFLVGLTVISTYSDGPATLTPELTTYSFNGNDYLTDTNGNIQLEPAGYTFGPDTLSGQTWGQIGSSLPLLSSGSGDYWSGFGGEPPECFIGVRFLTGGEQHYGWIRLLMPTRQPPQAGAQATVFPVVADWAYETRPDTAIRAGETGQDDEPELFTVDFENPDGTPAESDIRRSSGSFILQGDTLHYEMVVVGTHTNLDVLDPADSMPVFSMVEAPTVLPGFPTYVIGGIHQLSHPQIAQIRHGSYYVSVDQGVVLGRIVPAKESPLDKIANSSRP
ncbi:MAG TPA: hypothetical protein VG754_13920 [Verrucomicrobiae bacterium]|nr:hypothetical protein [Verrucomicrobiae bacterium]